MFDDLSDVYEALIDWPRRLAHEEPFYRRLFDRFQVRRVLDVACGTGHHAALFASWGLTVEGADASPSMIAKARGLHGELAELRWVVRGFEEPVVPIQPWDAALCVGNSLALARDAALVEQAIGNMLAAVRPGGVIVVHLLNLWRFADGPCIWQKIRRATIEQQEVLILKGVHRCGSRGYVDLVVAPLTDAAPLRADAVPFLGLEASQLEQLAIRAGGRNVRFFGGYQEQPYDRDHSVDLIVIAER